MDHLANGEIAQAADIIAQRMHACKIADEDGSWHKARYAELILPDSINMVSKEMRMMTDREDAAQKRLAKLAPRVEPIPQDPTPAAAPTPEEPWIIKKGGKTYMKGWIMQVKGGKPFKKGKNKGGKGKNKNWWE